MNYLLIHLSSIELYIILHKANQTLEVNFLQGGNTNWNPKLNEQMTLCFILLTFGKFVWMAEGQWHPQHGQNCSSKDFLTDT